MRIVIDLQGAQSASRYRGIGRYSLSLSKAIAKNSSDEVIILLSNLFPETINDIKNHFKDILPPQNIKVWNGISPVKESEAQNSCRREISEVLREAFISSLNPDIVLISSLFEGYIDNAVTSVKKYNKDIKTAVIGYDLIPYIHQDKYLTDVQYKNYYLKKIEYFKKADVILGISQSSCKEITKYLNIENKKVINISAAVDESFSVEKAKIDKETLYRKFNITKKTILYTPGGFDKRKNLKNLIEAYSILPKNIKFSYQLVISGKIEESEKLRLLNFAKSKNLDKNSIVFTGYLTDEELISFYSYCDLFIFPSIHEGFGLPLLEAMNCGAVVIGSNTTSIPEVIGFKEALFNPHDIQSISNKIKETLTNPQLRENILKNSKEQIKKFSWDISAKKAIKAFKEIINPQEAKEWQDSFNEYKKNYNKQIKAVAAICKECKVKEEELYSISKAIAKNQEAAEEFLKCRQLPQKITWRIEGPFDSSYSLALLNRETALALDELGHNVILHSTEGPGDFEPSQEFLEQNPKIEELYLKSFQIPQERADVTSRNLYPPRVDDMKSPLNMLHHYAWEESGFPQEWAADFNEHLQGITALSTHVEKILIDNGVTVPLITSGCGVDHWERIKADNSYKINDSSTFRFLHVSSCFPRKGADVLLKAYGKAFSSSDDVALIIKTFPNPHNKIHDWLQEAKENNPNYPKVIIIEEDLTKEQLKALYNQCDCLVAPSRAEGFGLPMAEAMLSNLAVITTAWGGQLDFCNEETAWLIDYQFAPAKTHFELFNSVWAEPSIEHLAMLMQKVYSLSKKERIKKIQKAKEKLLKQFTWKNTALNLIKAARIFSQNSFRKTPKIGWISTWNTKCGIAAYSKHLINNMYEPVTILADYSSERIEKDANNVYRCWKQGEDDLNKLSQTIENLSLDTIVIQFNYGFFNFDSFNKFLLEHIRKQRTILITLHSTKDPKHLPNKELKKLIPSLSKCNRILVHSYNDLNRLKELQLIHNAMLFPHGILNWENKEQSKKDGKTFIIASYGFFLPHKGLLELIKALSILIKEDKNIKLKMVNAIYPAPQSYELVNKAKKLIETLKLNNYIELHTNFLEDKESLKLLSQADLIIFPYQETGESSSAAVRYGLATGKPVAVTPLEIFNDVQEAVFKLPGTSAQDIAKGVQQLIKEIKLNTPYIQKKQQNANNWRNAHNYSHIALRLTNILIALKKQKILKKFQSNK